MVVVCSENEVGMLTVLLVFQGFLPLKCIGL